VFEKIVGTYLLNYTDYICPIFIVDREDLVLQDHLLQDLVVQDLLLQGTSPVPVDNLVLALIADSVLALVDFIEDPTVAVSILTEISSKMTW
jgi:hypothetical protein